MILHFKGTAAAPGVVLKFRRYSKALKDTLNRMHTAVYFEDFVKSTKTQSVIDAHKNLVVEQMNTAEDLMERCESLIAAGYDLGLIPDGIGFSYLWKTERQAALAVMSQVSALHKEPGYEPGDPDDEWKGAVWALKCIDIEKLAKVWALKYPEKTIL